MRHRLLLLDDDPDMLEIYRETLQRLRTQPIVQTATNGPRAIAMLEEESYSLLITDFSLPRMDGLQVLAVVRRRWPQLKTAVMSSVADEDFKRRAQGMGIDLYCEKPTTSKEIEVFLQRLDELVSADEAVDVPHPAGTSLQELLRLEALSRNSCVIRCSQGGLSGKLWIQNGEVIDAALADLQGQDALDQLLIWKNPVCEVLAPEDSRPKRILPASGGPSSPSAPVENAARLPLFRPPSEEGYHAPAAEPTGGPPSDLETDISLAEFTRLDGVHLVLSARRPVQEGLDSAPRIDSWGAENPDELERWCSGAIKGFNQLGSELELESVTHIEVLTPAMRLSIAPKAGNLVCVGFDRTMAPESARETLKLILSKWVS